MDLMDYVRDDEDIAAMLKRVEREDRRVRREALRRKASDR